MNSRHALALLASLLASGCSAHRSAEKREAQPSQPTQEKTNNFVYPECTEEERASGFSGKALVSCTITTKGDTEDCEVKQALPPMTERIVDAIERSSFKPILYRGKPVAVRYTFTIDIQCKK